MLPSAIYKMADFTEQLRNTPHLKLHGAASYSATRLRSRNLFKALEVY